MSEENLKAFINRFEKVFDANTENVNNSDKLSKLDYRINDMLRDFIELEEKAANNISLARTEAILMLENSVQFLDNSPNLEKSTNGFVTRVNSTLNDIEGKLRDQKSKLNQQQEQLEESIKNLREYLALIQIEKDNNDASPKP